MTNDSQGRFKVTSKFNPQWGGGYDVKVEDLNTGQVRETWCRDLDQVDTSAQSIAQGLIGTSAGGDVRTSYLDVPGEEESPQEDATETAAEEASEAE